MKNRVVKLFILVIALAAFLIGCAAKEKVDEAINPPLQESNQASDPAKEQLELSDEIKEQAKKEGVSIRQFKKTLDGLTEIGAKKYGVTVDEYIAQIEADGNTVLSEWKVASDYMGISITELYEYEKNKATNMTDEQKEIMQGMNDALKMADEELRTIGSTDAGNIIGIEENSTGEIRIVTMSDKELKEALTYESYKITQEYTDEYSIVFDYISDADIHELAKHYESLILNTEAYMKMKTPDSLNILYQGTINETRVYIELDNTQGGMVTVAAYMDLSSKK